MLTPFGFDIIPCSLGHRWQEPSDNFGGLLEAIFFRSVEES